MEIYKVTNIEEADYGCEENTEGARALITLTDAKGRKTSTVAAEEWLTFTGIDTGKAVVYGADGKLRPIVTVAAAVICAERNSKKCFLATQRGYGEYKDKWEFPGGKSEPGETSEAALVREIREELDTEITVGEHFFTVQYDYPRFHLHMDCFLAQLAGKAPVLKEHKAAKWLSADTAYSVDWLPADMDVLEKLVGLMADNGIDS